MTLNEKQLRKKDFIIEDMQNKFNYETLREMINRVKTKNPKLFRGYNLLPRYKLYFLKLIFQ